MNKRKYFILIILCFSLCACSKTVSEDEGIAQETEVIVSQSEELPELDTNNQIMGSSEETFHEQELSDELSEQELEYLPDYEVSEEEMEFLKLYHGLCIKEDVKRMSLIYLDEDTIPELLLLKDGEYRLYSFDGDDVKEIVMPDTEIKANVYGPRHVFEDSEDLTFYWFEYVPYQGLIRVHGGDEEERHDYYLRYTEGLLQKELEAKNIKYTWHTYNAEKEIENEDFMQQLANLGYDQLIPCGNLYENVYDAYKNIDAKADAREVLDDFVNGKIDALDHVEEICDIPEDGFVMESYKEYYDTLETEVDGYVTVKIIYIDFDNDGEDELILQDYMGGSYFFDVIGGTVCKVLDTGGTGDESSVVKIEGDTFIARTDLTHVGRQNYNILKYDACCCLVDWFRLYAEYEGGTYSEGDRFEYRDKGISMEQFEKIVDSIQYISHWAE